FLLLESPNITRGRNDNGAGGKDIEMITVIGIIVADLIVVALFIYQHRQELGLTVNGEYDLPVVRKKSVGSKAVRPSTEGDQAKRGQVVPGEGSAGSGTVRKGRRNAGIRTPPRTT